MAKIVNFSVFLLLITCVFSLQIHQRISIFVSNLSYETTTEQLSGLFEQYGEVRRVHIPIDRETGILRGYAFVEF